MDYTKYNSKIIDQWVEDGWEWGKPISHEEYLKAKQGDFKLVLTPTKSVPKDWFPNPMGRTKNSRISCWWRSTDANFECLGC